MPTNMPNMSSSPIPLATSTLTADGATPNNPPSAHAWWRVMFWKKPLHLLLPTDPVASSSTADDTREMDRTLGLFDLIMIGIGGTVGTGVFATAGLIAKGYAGPAAILSWLIAGAGCILSAFSFMELSCLIPADGSTYAYVYHALGELPAMLAGFLLTLEYGISSAGAARSWSDKFTTWLREEWHLEGPAWMKPADSVLDLYAGLMLTVILIIVLRGMQAGKVFVNTVTMTKISVVLFIIIFGLLRFNPSNMTPFVPEAATNAVGEAVFGWPGVFLGASASFFGYIGYDEVCCLAGEAKHPKRNIPRAVIGTIVGAAALSTLATTALVGMQWYADIDSDESYGKAFAHAGWKWAGSIVSTGEVLTMPITTFVSFLAQPRVQYAMAKDGLLPALFGRVDKHGNLFQGTLVSGIALIVIALFVPFQYLWDFISLGILVAFNLTNASLLLVRGEPLRQDPARRSLHRLHSYLIVVFLLTSFFAAFHWQKSVIAPIPITDDMITPLQWYLEACGPPFAVLFSVFACVSMIGIRIVEGKAEAVAQQTSSPESAACASSSSNIQEKPEPTRDSSESLESARRRWNKEADTEDETLSTTSGDDLMSGGTQGAASTSNTDDGDDDDDNDTASFKAPLVPFTPCVAIFFNWFLFAQMNAMSVAFIVLWMLLALTIYLTYSMHRSLAHAQTQYCPVDLTDGVTKA